MNEKIIIELYDMGFLTDRDFEFRNYPHIIKRLILKNTVRQKTYTERMLEIEKERLEEIQTNKK